MTEQTDIRTDSPAQRASGNYAMPAEWAPHQCTWLSWPHNRDTWPGKFAPVEPVMTRFVAALAKSELVRINVLDERHERHVQSLLEGSVNSERVRFHRIPTNDAWCRDHGAIFVNNEDSSEPLVALDFRFNSWGGKYPPFDLDDAAARQMASHLDVPCRSLDFVLEGGSIDVNGAGALLTTEQCLLHPNRNPGMSREAIETLLMTELGVDTVHWLGDGIVGDDTDGHIDDLTRFVSEDQVVTVVENNRSDDNFAALSENRERLQAMRLADGRPLRIVELDMPAPLEFRGDRLPASYANFYIANTVVVVPTFDDPADAPNLRKLEAVFPGREVIGIDCRDLVLGLGTFHCLSQQVPRLG